MKEQFCNYEISLKLKELGFDEECMGAYMIRSSGDKYFSQISSMKPNYSKWDIYVPLWQQVQSFLDDNGVIIGIIFVDNVFKYTLNIENYVSNEFKDRMSALKSATEHATSYLWNKKFGK